MPKSTIQHNLKPSLRPRPKWKAVPDGLLDLWPVYVYPAYSVPRIVAYFLAEEEAFAEADKLWKEHQHQHTRKTVRVGHAAGVVVNGKIHVCHIASSLPAPVSDSSSVGDALNKLSLDDSIVERLAVHHEDFGLGQVDSYGITTHGFSGHGLRKFVDNLFEVALTSEVNRRSRLDLICLEQAAQREDSNVETYLWQVRSKDSSSWLSFYTGPRAIHSEVAAFISREYPNFDTSSLKWKPCLAKEVEAISIIPKSSTSNEHQIHSRSSLDL